MVLQWNARSLIANGQEFKGFIQELSEVPDVICVQESWLKSHLDFVIKGFTSIRRDRVGSSDGGGCVTFVKNGLQFRELKKSVELEVLCIEVWTKV